MRARALVMFALAVVLGLGAVYFARNWLQQQVRPVMQAQGPKIALTTTVVAKVGLQFGSKITSEHVREVSWPADAMPQGSYRTVQDMFKEAGERVVLRNIEAGEPVLATKLSGPGGRATLSTVITEQMRAMTIRVNDVVGVAGFVLPGDRVDVLVTRDEPKGHFITDILLQNVRVLGIDQVASDRHDKPTVVKAVTIEVSPNQAQKVTLASQVGILTLALRNILNGDAALASTITTKDLRIGEAVKPPEPQVIAKKVQPVVRVKTHAEINIVRGLAGREYAVQKDGGPTMSPRPLVPATGRGAAPAARARIAPADSGAEPAAPAARAKPAQQSKVPTAFEPPAQ